MDENPQRLYAELPTRPVRDEIVRSHGRHVRADRQKWHRAASAVELVTVQERS